MPTRHQVIMKLRLLGFIAFFGVVFWGLWLSIHRWNLDWPLDVFTLSWYFLIAVGFGTRAHQKFAAWFGLPRRHLEHGKHTLFRVFFGCMGLIYVIDILDDGNWISGDLASYGTALVVGGLILYTVGVVLIDLFAARSSKTKGNHNGEPAQPDAAEHMSDPE
jgi:hypothetical protein